MASLEARRRIRAAVASAGQRCASRLQRASAQVASPANPSCFQARSHPRSWGMPLMTDRIKDFLARNREDGPRLVVDLDVVRENYLGFANALPDTRVFYAVKANPAPEILDLLAGLGSCFDTASVGEIEQALAAGATPDRISFGNTIKKEKDIARAYALGVRLFAVDCEAEVEKIARAAPGAKVFCRILCDGAGAEWPLSRKFGCAPEMAARRARTRACAWPHRAWPVVPCRLAAAQPAHVGSGAEGFGGDLPGSRRARHPARHDQPRRRLSDPLFEGRARDQDLRADDLPRVAPAFRQPDSGDDHRARPRHGRQRRNDRGRGGADLEEGGRATGSAGSISTSASSMALPRRRTR